MQRCIKCLLTARSTLDYDKEKAEIPRTNAKQVMDNMLKENGAVGRSGYPGIAERHESMSMRKQFGTNSEYMVVIGVTVGTPTCG